MPGPLRSPELARKAQERLPNIAVLFTSGYTENAIVHGGRLDEGVELLSKPYTRDALARKIRQVLTAHRRRREANISAPRYQQPLMEPRGVDGEARKLSILVVEDEPLILMVTSEMLENLQHEVTGASNGNEAIEMIRHQDFDVLITDLSLPGVSGETVALEALKLRPDLKVIFATGASQISVDGIAEPILLRKPFQESDIIVALERALMTNVDG